MPAAMAERQSRCRVAALRGGRSISQTASAAMISPHRIDQSPRIDSQGIAQPSASCVMAHFLLRRVAGGLDRIAGCRLLALSGPASRASIAPSSSGASCSASTRPRINCSADPWKNRARKSESRLPVASRRETDGPVEMRLALLLVLDQPGLLHRLQQAQHRRVRLAVAPRQVLHQPAHRHRAVLPEHSEHRELPLGDRQRLPTRHRATSPPRPPTFHDVRILA